MDIVERLKKMAGKGDYYDDEYQAAIAEIERLRKENENQTKAIWAKNCEIERLREHIENYKKLWETSNALDQQISEDWSAECKRLREALREIHGLGDTPDDSWKAYQICCRALGEKE